MIHPHRFVETLYSEVPTALSTGSHLTLSADYCWGCRIAYTDLNLSYRAVHGLVYLPHYRPT